MHRTQVLLEDRQYQALRERARREYRSLSELVRAAVDRWLGVADKRKTRKRRLEDMRGIFRTPEGVSGRDHDEFLYGWRK